LGSAFVQRAAICGSPSEGGLEDVVASLSRKGWSLGASLNLVDLRARRMANVEVHKDAHAVREVTSAMGNYSHFNMYKTLGPGMLDPPEPSSQHRQARVDALPPARTSNAVRLRLSDSTDTEFPIFRDMTLGTFVLDGSSGTLSVWCCGLASATHQPAYQWNISSFWHTQDEPSFAPLVI